MFERRLRIVLLIPILCGMVLVTRLFQLQVVQGEAYQQEADEALVAPRQFLPPLRGRILDRFGENLVSDEPATDVTIHYGALSLNESYLQRLANRLKRHDHRWRSASPAELEAEVNRRIAEMWSTLQRVSGIPLSTLRQRRDAVCNSVENLRRHLWRVRRRQGFEEPLDKVRIREQDLFHPLLRDISPEVRTRIELGLSEMPFLRIEPSVRRVWSGRAEPLCHVLGTLGEISTERIRNDPQKDDWLAAYRAGDRAGTSGVEYLAEEILRGKRGFEEKYLDGRRKEMVPPIDGQDVTLTIDLDLQERIAEILREAVAEQTSSAGGACVVLDVQTREILALVSIPTFTSEQFKEDYASLRDDARRRPLLFRAVAEEYQPGSIIKPLCLLAGFKNGLVDPAHQAFCDGSFIPDSPKWHCWTHWRGLPGHGSVDANDAIKHSCNVYFYGLGQRVNARRLTEFYDDFIRTSPDRADGATMTGLIEERSGIIPTYDWMREHRRRSFRPADGRNYAIGQGEIQITPLQAANIFATLATGESRAPTLLADDGQLQPASIILGLSADAWRITRRGVYRCVNEQGGTAYKSARLDNLEVCGKTGSAQCVARAIRQRFTFDLGDGQTRSAEASTVEAAREILDLPSRTTCVKRRILERWPPHEPDKTEAPTHAWFAAFAPYRNPRIALAVVVEHGGGGSRAAGPVGKAVFEALMASPHHYLSQSDKITLVPTESNPSVGPSP